MTMPGDKATPKEPSIAPQIVALWVALPLCGTGWLPVHNAGHFRAFLEQNKAISLKI